MRARVPIADFAVSAPNPHSTGNLRQVSASNTQSIMLNIVNAKLNTCYNKEGTIKWNLKSNLFK